MVDTSGGAFAYPLARLAGVRVAAYVHYPTVSADMLAAVAARRPAFNNHPALAANWARSAAKLAYYYVFAGCLWRRGGLRQRALGQNRLLCRSAVLPQCWRGWARALLCKKHAPSAKALSWGCSER